MCRFIEKKSAGPILLLFPVIVMAGYITCANAAPLPELDIRYHEQIDVEETEVKFSDIAEIRGVGDAVDRLKNITVCRASNFGLSRYLSTESLYEKHLKALETSYKVTGHDERRIRITTVAEVLPKDTLAALVERFLEDFFAGRNGEYHFELLPENGDVLVPRTPYQLSLRPLKSYRSTGAQKLELVIENGSGIMRVVPVKVNIRHYDTVWVARRKISRDEVVSPSAWAREFREVTRLEGDPVRSLEDVEGMLTRQTIIPGRVLTTRFVRLTPVIKQGEDVKVTARRGSITVVLDGVARQDGCLGQVISVKNHSSHELIKARILGAGELELVSMAARR